MSDIQLLHTLLARPIAFHPALARLAGRATAGIFLSQLYYWCERSSHVDGWVYKTSTEWEAETTLSEDEQRGARKLLASLGVLESAYAAKHFAQMSKFDRTLCYRINFDRLAARLRDTNYPPPPRMAEGRKFPNGGFEIPISTSHKARKECRESPVHTTETTPEITAETTTPEATANTSTEQIDQLVDAALWQANRSGNRVRAVAAWKRALRARLKANGATIDDVAALAEYRVALGSGQTLRAAIEDAEQKTMRTATGHAELIVATFDALDEATKAELWANYTRGPAKVIIRSVEKKENAGKPMARETLLAIGKVRVGFAAELQRYFDEAGKK